MCHARGKNGLEYGLFLFFGGAVPFRTPFQTSYFTSSLLTAFLPVCDLPFFCHILRDGRGLYPEGSATPCRHGRRSNGSTTTTKGGCADEPMSHTQQIQGDSTVTLLQYARDFVT